jgi:hypothetical protein
LKLRKRAELVQIPPVSFKRILRQTLLDAAEIEKSPNILGK